MKKDVEIFKLVWGSSVRALIVNELFKKDKMTISELHKEINLYFGENPDQDYKNTYKHLKVLEREKIVKLVKEKKEQGQPVYVILIKKNLPETLLHIFKSGTFI